MRKAGLRRLPLPVHLPITHAHILVRPTHRSQPSGSSLSVPQPKWLFLFDKRPSRYQIQAPQIFFAAVDPCLPFWQTPITHRLGTWLWRVGLRLGGGHPGAAGRRLVLKAHPPLGSGGL
jgi:hypothetical protein